MALNFSHRPIFPAHFSEDNLVSPIRMANGYFEDGIPERNGDVFANPWHSVREGDGCFDFGRDRADRCGSQEVAPKDILDILPPDPFGMDISSTFTALTGWLEDLEVDYSGYARNARGPSTTDYEIFAGLNFIWNKALEFQIFPGDPGISDKFDGRCGFGREKKLATDFYSDNVGPSRDREDTMDIDIEFSVTSDRTGEEFPEGCSAGDVGSPYAALPFALGYLGVRDLLSVERVCRFLCSTVRSDPLLWRSIHIDQPLNDKITDDVLLNLTDRAQGNLQCLSLIECQRITDDGLMHVLESNRKISKLSVPGCTRLSIDGVVNSIKATKNSGIKHLRIGGLYGVTERNFEELKFLLGIDSQLQGGTSKPHYYQRGQLYMSCDNDRAIDIEMCPKCNNLRLVYDCPAEGCRGKEHADATQSCRGCRICVARCVQCGRCINDGEYEETFCLEWLCSDCWKKLPGCQEMQDISFSG